MEEVLRQEPQKLKKAIFFGSLIPLLVYFLFALIIIGICGSQTSEDAISSLYLFLPKWISKFGASLGILTMATSFLAIGYVLREVWHRDFHLPRLISFSLALLPPLVLFLLGAKSFIIILEYTGALTGGLTGILIIACYLQAKKEGQRQPLYSFSIPKLLLLILGIIFLIGMITPLITSH